MNYIAFRVFEFFDKKDNQVSLFRTISFLTLFQISFILPLFLIINLFYEINLNKIFSFEEFIYFLILPLGAILALINTSIYKIKLKGESLNRLKEKYHEERYAIPIWVIFITPIICVFFIPIIYGALNGTLKVGF